MTRSVLLVTLCWMCLGATARAQLFGDAADAVTPLSTPRIEQAGKNAEITYASDEVADAFNGVVVQGFSTDPAFEGWVRFEDADGWTPWRALYLVRSATDAAFLAAYRGDTVRQRQRFELRFFLDGSQRLDLVGAGVFDSRNDADRAPAAPDDAPESPAKTGHHVNPPMMIPRATWDAEPFRGTPIALARPSYDFMTFHHAAGFGGTTLAEGLAQVKNIQDFHQNGRGWSDIGYQFVMDQSGRLYQGRPFLNGPVNLKDVPTLVQGAHVGGNNTGNIGLCVLGCYHPPEGSFCQDRMTPAAFDSLATMFAFLSEAYGVPPDRLRGHRDFSATACPGDNNYALLPTLRERIEELLRTGNQSLGIAALDALVDDDGVVRLAWEFVEDRGIAGYRLVRVEDGVETILFEGESATPDVYSDAGLTRAGVVEYRLVAVGATGREQVLAASQVTVETPSSYTLAHSFPNPFQRATTIRYFLQRDGLVTLTVYDVTGRAVARLDDAFRDGGRWYSHTFDGSGLPSGTYFYRLQVEGFSGIDYDKTRAVTLTR